MSYKIVRAFSSNLGNAEDKLTEEVNKLIKDGWKPQGGIAIYEFHDTATITTIIVSQAMIKEEEPSNN